MRILTENTYGASKMKFVVTRQMQWPESKLMVELSEGGIDYANPDTLVQRYNGEFEEFDDACIAAETAISIFNAWKKDTPEEDIFLGVGYTMGMTMPFNECTPDELRKWAENVKMRGKRCELCNNIAIEGGTLCEDCSRECYEDSYEEEEEGE